jgi:hypothetical protein
MQESDVWGLSSDELESAIASVDATALFLPPRILRRVIKQDRGLPDPGLSVPHRKSYVIHRDRLLQIVDRSEFGLSDRTELPEVLILLPRPEAEQLAAMTRPRALLKYWRLLFHARVHVELDKLVADDRLTPTSVQDRIARIGRLEFEEIRAVLKQEDLLLPPVDDVSTYIEFVAVYLELRQFIERLLPDYFPSISDWSAIDALVAHDIDGEHWFNETRLPGCPEPNEGAVEDEELLTARRTEPSIASQRKQSERAYCRLMERADRARERGNDVRSATLRWQAAQVIGPKLAKTSRNMAREDLDRLASRLGKALDLQPEAVSELGELLGGMLHLAARGLWTAEARFLYDLQNVCVDHERGVYALDMVGWLLSRGRQPIKRPLPSQREVLLSKHLRAAQHRLRSVRLSPQSREQLSSLMEEAVKHTDRRLRDSFRPRLDEALSAVGLTAANRPELVARRKLVEELLDLIVERGFLNMGDLRDAISRNDLKLHDVENVKEVLHGDQMLRADRLLGKSLDGVYRPGEVYLRLPQSLSSLAFGTAPGRFLTRYLAIPFGGAYVVLKFLQHQLMHAPFHMNPEKASHFENVWSIGLLGLFFLLLYNPAFRHGCVDVLHGVYRLIYQVFVAIPLRILRSPLVRRIVRSSWFRRCEQLVFKPLLFGGLVGAAMSLVQAHPISWPTGVGLFLGINLLLNSRWGRNVDEMVTDFVVRSWHRIRIRIFAAIVHWIVEFFHQTLELMERVLYTVDEWLRFRAGESRLTTGTKTVLGVVWFFVNYVIRFCITLLIEPQINPIKHFPVVTVSHKLILPLAPFFIDALSPHLGAAEAKLIVISTIWLIPGVFGFLVWELKENWRLYAANRSLTLRPVMVGRHGENVMRLLRPGFHSGTIPRLFARLRRADRKAHATGIWRKSRKFREKLNETQESVQRFVDRVLIALLETSPAWKGMRLRAEGVHMGLTSLRLPVYVDKLEEKFGNEPLVITLEEKAGWLVAHLERPAWFERLSPEQIHAWTAALSGFYAMSGVDLVREQIEACFEPNVPRYDLCEQGLVVWPEPHGDLEVIYNLRESAEQVPLVTPSAPCALPTLDRHRLVFASSPIRWSNWVDLWKRESRHEALDANTEDQEPQVNTESM